MKKILMALAVLLMTIGYTTFSANADDHGRDPMEMTEETTEAVTDIFAEDDCADKAMTDDVEAVDGEAMADDCAAEDEAEAGAEQMIDDETVE